MPGVPHPVPSSFQTAGCCASHNSCLQSYSFLELFSLSLCTHQISPARWTGRRLCAAQNLCCWQTLQTADRGCGPALSRQVLMHDSLDTGVLGGSLAARHALTHAPAGRLMLPRLCARPHQLSATNQRCHDFLAIPPSCQCMCWHALLISPSTGWRPLSNWWLCRLGKPKLSRCNVP